jgi:hypothetical protein
MNGPEPIISVTCTAGSVLAYFSVVEGEARAEHEGIDEIVGRHRPGIDHLRLRLEVLVERKQLVEDQRGMRLGDRCGGEDRIEVLEIALRHHLERGFRGGVLHWPGGEQRHGGERAHGDADGREHG